MGRVPPGPLSAQRVFGAPSAQRPLLKLTPRLRSCSFPSAGQAANQLPVLFSHGRWSALESARFSPLVADGPSAPQSALLQLVAFSPAHALVLAPGGVHVRAAGRLLGLERFDAL